ncbi:helix-turn-helix domain-containing protein [Enterobacter asburiae]|uniref:helix-turn-helix domain-containing protein n=1 Tax=Enterobacter asburiae TaxID=61645 RepID=UPI003F54EF15
MTGYDLRLWRIGLGWSRDRAAEELGVSLRTWKDYENAPRVKRAVELATIALSIHDMLPRFQDRQVSKQRVTDMLKAVMADALPRKPQTTL